MAEQTAAVYESLIPGKHGTRRDDVHR
jgi:hypothetical protein